MRGAQRGEEFGAVIQPAIKDNAERRLRERLPLADFFGGGPEMPVTERDASNLEGIASIGAAVLQGFQNGFHRAALQRRGGSFKDYSKGAHNRPRRETRRSFVLLRINRQRGIAHERPAEQHIQRFGVGQRQFGFGVLQRIPDGHARQCEARR